MFDIGKRERKPTQSNLNEGALLKRMVLEGKGSNRGKHMKLPKQLRLPRIDDVWTFFDRDRLRELQKVGREGGREGGRKGGKEERIATQATPTHSQHLPLPPSLPPSLLSRWKKIATRT